MRYANEIKETAFGYYCKGLNSKEIAKLMNLKYRSIQEFMQKEGWKKQRSDLQAKEEKRIIKKYLKAQRPKSTRNKP